MSHITRSVTPPPEPQLHDEYTTFDKKQKRHGHDQDVTDDNDIRQVAGCLPLDMKTRRVLLISSSKNEGSWVLVTIFFHSSIILSIPSYSLQSLSFSLKVDGNKTRQRNMLLNVKLGKRPVSREPLQEI